MIVERSIRRHFLVLTCLFVGACVLGFFAPAWARETLLTQLRAFFLPARGLPHMRLFLFILLHNVVASLVTLVAGVVYGLMPIVSVAGNGVALGMACRQVLPSHGWAAIALRVVPHGVFELPAFLLAASYGLWLGMPSPGRTEGGGEIRLGERIKDALRGYAVIVLPLLIGAAAIEAFLVPGLR